ncbi:MAG: hypothetical protein JXA41_15960 [Deltaproteobacteria bacterium]|nr:hypothetical protein [Deltaproteobacteria bacterium]
MAPFMVMDCTLLIKMSGLPPAFNIRDLRNRIAICRPEVIYHHFCENLLAPTFDYPDFRNDFAVWVKRRLEDNLLAEQLGLIDPYEFDSMEDLRSFTLDIIDEHIACLHTINTINPGHEFFLKEAVTVVFETGKILADPSELTKVIPVMTNGSIYYHFLEARRRNDSRMDDFSIWLELFGETWKDKISSLRSIDFIFYTLTELKQEIFRVLR